MQLRIGLSYAAVSAGLWVYAPSSVAKPVASTPVVVSNATSAEGEISIDFPDAVELKDLVGLISRWTNKNVILDKRVTGKIQILAPNKVTKQVAYEAFLSAVDALNLMVLETGSLIKIVPKREGLNSTPPLMDARSINHSDRVYTQIFPLKYAGAEAVRNTVSRLTASTALVAHVPTNVLILTESGANLKRVGEFIDIIDRSSGEGLHYEFIPVRNLAASRVAKKVTELFQRQGSHDGPKVIVDERSNSLVLAGNKSIFAGIHQFVTMLDQAPTFGETSESKIYIYPLSFADAKKVAAVLNSISPPSKNASRPAADKIQITADEPTNSLLVGSSFAAYKTLNPIIRRLDRERAQVFIDVDVIGVSATNNFSFLPSLLGGSAQSDGTGTKTIVGYQASQMAPLIVSQVNANSQSSTNAKTVASAFSQDLTIGMFSGTRINVPGLGLISPGLLLTAMKTDAHGRSISSPKLLTMDNEEANFTTGTTFIYKTTATDDVGNMSQRPEKENTELSMKVKPSVGGSEYLTLEIELNANSIASYTEDGIPIIAKKKARQLVNLKNGQTVLISGIRNLNRSTNETTVPFLGSIPVLGWLFNSRKTENSSDYVFVFMTTHIIRGANDLQALYEKRFKEMDPRKSRLAMDLENRNQGATGRNE